jgi:hypothetical protein
METKDELIVKIKQWIQLDNEIKEKEKSIKLLKVDKKKISELLIQTMKTNEIDCVNIQDGALLFKKQTVKQSLNKKLLQNCLIEYLKDSEKANEMSEFILGKRGEKVVESIKRKVI